MLTLSFLDLSVEEIIGTHQQLFHAVFKSNNQTLIADIGGGGGQAANPMCSAYHQDYYYYTPPVSSLKILLDKAATLPEVLS